MGVAFGRRTISKANGLMGAASQTLDLKIEVTGV
jgi:hypothetical protein